MEDTITRSLKWFDCSTYDEESSNQFTLPSVAEKILNMLGLICQEENVPFSCSYFISLSNVHICSNCIIKVHQNKTDFKVKTVNEVQHPTVAVSNSFKDTDNETLKQHVTNRNPTSHFVLPSTSNTEFKPSNNETGEDLISGLQDQLKQMQKMVDKITDEFKSCNNKHLAQIIHQRIEPSPYIQKEKTLNSSVQSTKTICRAVETNRNTVRDSEDSGILCIKTNKATQSNVGFLEEQPAQKGTRSKNSSIDSTRKCSVQMGLEMPTDAEILGTAANESNSLVEQGSQYDALVSLSNKTTCISKSFAVLQESNTVNKKSKDKKVNIAKISQICSFSFTKEKGVLVKRALAFKNVGTHLPQKYFRPNCSNPIKLPVKTFVKLPHKHVKVPHKQLDNAESDIELGEELYESSYELHRCKDCIALWQEQPNLAFSESKKMSTDCRTCITKSSKRSKLGYYKSHSNRDFFLTLKQHLEWKDSINLHIPKVHRPTKKLGKGREQITVLFKRRH